MIPGLKLAAYAVLLFAAVAVVASLIGSAAWKRATAAMVGRLNHGVLRVDAFPDIDMDALPAPVARYFSYAMADRHVRIRTAEFSQRGTFRKGAADAPWSDFRATQYVTVDRPGFVWDALIDTAPGMRVHVRDGYVNGRASMKAALLSLIPVVDEHDKPELDEAALQRYLAEAVWFPPALLPGRGLVWTPIDDSTARATLTDGATTASIDFHFNERGEVVRVYTPARYFEANGAYVRRPWQGYFRNYDERGGMRIPLEGEVQWLMPEGPLTYWRGRLEKIAYEASTPEMLVTE